MINGQFLGKLGNGSVIFFNSQKDKKLKMEEKGKYCIKTFLVGSNAGDAAGERDPLNLIYLRETIEIKNDEEEVVVGSLNFKLSPLPGGKFFVQVTVMTHDKEKREGFESGRTLSSTSFQTPPNADFIKFVIDCWRTIGEGTDAQLGNWFDEAATIPPERKLIIARTIRSIAAMFPINPDNNINIKITVQEVRNYQDAISHEEISTRFFGKFAYVVLNLIKDPAEDALKALRRNADGTFSDLPLKELIKRYSLLSVDNFIRLAKGADFRDPRTRAPILSVHKVFFLLDEERVAPREAEKLAKVQAQVADNLKRPRSSSFGGGQTYYKFD